MFRTLNAEAFWSRSLVGRFVVVALAGVSCGCAIGPKLSRSGVTTQPGGAEAYIVLRSHEAVLEGELIAAEATGVIILESSTGRMLHVNNSLIRRVDLRGTGRRIHYRSGSPPVEDVSPWSRYPQGLGEPLLGRLLSTHNQRRLIEFQIGPGA